MSYWTRRWTAAVLAALLLPWAGVALEGRRPAVTADSTAVELPQKLIALTFDDGPKRSTTLPLLDGLAQRGVRATFFLIGEQIPGNEDILQRMEAEGHQLGIHTYDHVPLIDLNTADFSAQVERTQAIMERAVGHGDFLLRPPYGLVDEGVEQKAKMPIILWSIDPEDWKDKNAARVAQDVAAQASDGAVILLHDIYPTSVEAALSIVDALHEEGYHFVTIAELADLRHVELTAGQTYREFPP